jgi:hypothetical protein|eukprot:3956956-Prymnesium_polylepis.1
MHAAIGDCISKQPHIHYALLVKLVRVGVPVMVGELCQRVIQAVAASSGELHAKLAGIQEFGLFWVINQGHRADQGQL